MPLVAVVTLLAGFLTFAAVAIALIRAAWSLFATHRDLAVVIGRLWDIADSVEPVPTATDEILHNLRETRVALEGVVERSNRRNRRGAGAS